MNPPKEPGRQSIHFKLRFNTRHAGTNLYWRIFIGEKEYLATEIQCMVPTFSDASFDKESGEMKYNIAGICSEFLIDEDGRALLK